MSHHSIISHHITTDFNPQTTSQFMNKMNDNRCLEEFTASNTIAVIYAIIYTTVFLSVSIYSFYYLKQYDLKFQVAPCIKKIGIWLIDVYKRRSCYIPLVAHLFDQITDIFVVIQFYELAQTKSSNNWEACNGLNISYLFVITVSSLCIYRILSSYLLYRFTLSPVRVLFQLFDLELFR
eukprot:87111_1